MTFTTVADAPYYWSQALTRRIRNSLPRDVADKLRKVGYGNGSNVHIEFYNPGTDHQHTAILHASQVGEELTEEAIAWLCLECP
jgi:hypothetical protein